MFLKEIQGAYISLPKFTPLPGPPSETSIDLLVISFLTHHNFFARIVVWGSILTPTIPLRFQIMSHKFDN